MSDIPLERRVTLVERDVDDLKDVVYGDPVRGTLGLVAQQTEIARVIRTVDAAARIGKWVAGALATATGALIVNLMTGGLG